MLGAETDLVAVHDAVRPFIDPELIEQVIEEASQTGAAIVGIVPVDTVKRVHKNKIRATLPREHLVLAQTPQVFRFDLLKRAFELAREEFLPAPMKRAWWSGWNRWTSWCRAPIAISKSPNRPIWTWRACFGRGARRVVIRTGFGWDVHRLDLGAR